jgi:hypothetical protein
MTARPRERAVDRAPAGLPAQPPERTPVRSGGTHAPEGGAACGRAAPPSGSRRRKPKLTGLALMASLMPENGGKGSLEYALIKMLEDNFPQLLRQHNSDSRRAHEGFPDWVITSRCGYMIVRELKRESTQPTPAQDAWLAAFRAAGISARVWRPSDLLSGRIARELAALAGFGGQAE